jgi:hypothetical protein
LLGITISTSDHAGSKCNHATKLLQTSINNLLCHPIIGHASKQSSGSSSRITLGNCLPIDQLVHECCHVVRPANNTTEAPSQHKHLSASHLPAHGECDRSPLLTAVHCFFSLSTTNMKTSTPQEASVHIDCRSPSDSSCLQSTPCCCDSCPCC